MCKEKTATDDTRESQECCAGLQKPSAAGCPCGSDGCNARRCLPLLGVLALVVAVPMVAKMVKKSRAG